MNPEDPAVAQQVIAAYVPVLEEHDRNQRFPGALSALPYSRDTIKTAIRTSVVALKATGQMTAELREFLEGAYVALADFIEDELARLMAEYNTAAEGLASGQMTTADRMRTASWQTLRDSGGLAGRIAQRIATEAEELRTEFRAIEAEAN